jgi:outer membrane protein
MEENQEAQEFEQPQNESPETVEERIPEVIEKQSPTGMPAWLKPLLAVNGLLLLGLLAFALWYFIKGDKGGSSYPIVDKPSVMGVKIAYINNDSLTENYELVKEARRMLEDKKNRMEREIKAEQSALENEYRVWEKDVREAKLSELYLRKAQEELMKKEQALYRKSQEYTELLAQEEIDRNKVYIDSVLNYLERFNEVNNYDFILNYASGATLLLANDTFDITNVVLQGLNEEWLKVYPKQK